MAIFKAAAVQAAPVGGDTKATVEKAIRFIHESAALGVNVAVFPEAFVGGYPKGASFDIRIGSRTPAGRQEFADYHAAAICVPGPETDDIAAAVREAGLYLTIGVIERDGGTLYCTALYFTPEGLAGKHRKLMPTAAERICWGFGDGSTLDPVVTPWGRMGAVICWENYMPLLRTAMYGKGVSIYCAPTADDRDSWPATMQHIALEGRCFVISTCQYLTRKDFPSTMVNLISDAPDAVLMRGGAIIVDPLGRILAGPDYSGETILTAVLDTEDIVRAQFDFDVVGHYARPDVFGLAVDERPRSAVVIQR